MNKTLRFKMYVVSTLFFITSIGSASAALITNPAMPVTSVVRVQPIIVSDSADLGSTAGANPANFFGNATQQATIEGFIDEIWAQAGIDIFFRPPNFWQNTFANWGSNGPPNNGGVTRPTSDLTMIQDLSGPAGVRYDNPNVINMFFVNIPAGFGLCTICPPNTPVNGLTPNSAAGLAERPLPGNLGNDITQFVGSGLLDPNLMFIPPAAEVIAGVVAHEIGHNLSLPHIEVPENLMQSGLDANFVRGQRLTQAQINDALLSPLVVPVPGAVWLFATGLVGLIGLKTIRKA